MSQPYGTPLIEAFTGAGRSATKGVSRSREPDAPRRLGPRFLLLLVAAFLVWFTGCRKKQLGPAEIRAITRELVFAAKKATADKAEIGVRPETLPPQASPHPKGTRSGQAEFLADHLYITLPAGRSGQADPAVLEVLESALDRVARRHGLEHDARPGAAGLVRFDYRLGPKDSGQRTHAIHIIAPLLARRAAASGPAVRPSSARLAIIIDDLGYDRAAADALFALRFPLTVSVLPHLAYSADISEEAHRRGYQVMLHLPMESSNGDAKPEAIELRTGMGPAEVTRLLADMLETVPYAAGVNNHQGSRATADAQLMAAIMPVLRERELFFIDSRTTTATVAYAAALHAGVPAANRNVFLDDVPTPEAVRQQLALAARHARQQGYAIAIGHPHPATLQVLEEFVPQLEAHGVDLVFVSELAR